MHSLQSKLYIAAKLQWPTCSPLYSRLYEQVASLVLTVLVLVTPVLQVVGLLIVLALLVIILQVVLVLLQLVAILLALVLVVLTLQVLVVLVMQQVYCLQAKLARWPLLAKACAASLSKLSQAQATQGLILLTMQLQAHNACLSSLAQGAGLLRKASCYCLA